MPNMMTGMAKDTDADEEVSPRVAITLAETTEEIRGNEEEITSPAK